MLNIQKTKLWLTVQQWDRSSSTWLAAAYDTIDADEVSKQMQTFRKSVQQCEYGLADLGCDVFPEIIAEMRHCILKDLDVSK